jgi:ferrochelatase
MRDLIKQGVQRLLVACPSFVADCLETLEEIGIRAKEEWQQLGGKEFILVPCLNADPMWVKSVVELLLSAK